jgi:iron complex transport system ATP-binding protein
MAYVPQASDSHFDFSLAQMVEMGRTPHRGVFGGRGAHDRAHARSALARVGIERLAASSIHRVSGGERRLALIARALATEASHFLMDEPTASLDFGNQALILDEIARLRLAGAAVLFTTHHPDHALRIADRVVMLRDGAVLAEGAANTTLNPENLSALYGRRVEVAEAIFSDGTRRRTCAAFGETAFD